MLDTYSMVCKMHITIVIITKPVAAIVHAYCTYLLRMYCRAGVHLISYNLADFVGVELCQYFRMGLSINHTV